MLFNVQDLDLLGQCLLMFGGTLPVSTRGNAVGPLGDDDPTGTPGFVLVVLSMVGMKGGWQ